MLVNVFPTYPFLPWLFKKLPRLGLRSSKVKAKPKGKYQVKEKESEEEIKEKEVEKKEEEKEKEKEEMITAAVLFIEQELAIKEKADWHRVTADQLTKLGIAKFVQRFGLKYMLTVAYPSEQWDEDYLTLNTLKRKDKRKEIHS